MMRRPAAQTSGTNPINITVAETSKTDWAIIQCRSGTNRGRITGTGVSVSNSAASQNRFSPTVGNTRQTTARPMSAATRRTRRWRIRVSVAVPRSTADGSAMVSPNAGSFRTGVPAGSGKVVRRKRSSSHARTVRSIPGGVCTGVHLSGLSSSNMSINSAGRRSFVM